MEVYCVDARLILYSKINQHNPPFNSLKKKTRRLYPLMRKTHFTKLNIHSKVQAKQNKTKPLSQLEIEGNLLNLIRDI